MQSVGQTSTKSTIRLGESSNSSWSLSLLQRREESSLVSARGDWHCPRVRSLSSCIEYDLDEDACIEYILAIHRTRSRWNSVVLIRLALTIEQYFHQKALDNMRIGGKCKGSAYLSKADRVEVRREIANAAGTGTGNVDKVKAILQNARPNIVAAFTEWFTENPSSWKWCRLSKLKQKEEFANYEEEQKRRKILREFSEQSQASLDQRQVLEALQLFETRHPGQIRVCRSARQGTVIILRQDLVGDIKALEDANVYD